MIRNYLLYLPLLTTVLVFHFYPTVGRGQSFGFIPENVFVSSYDISHSTTDSVYQNDLEEESLLSKVLNQNRIPDNALAGSITNEETRHQFKLQYGLTSNINLGISLPFVTRQRKSNLTVNQSAYSDTASDLSSTEAADLGDVAIFGLWRFLYNDDLDLILGLKYKAGNAPYYIDQLDKLSLGSGMQEFSYILDLSLYSRRSKLSGNFYLSQTAYVFKEVVDGNNQKQTMLRTYALNGSFDVVYTIGSIAFGGGIWAASQGETVIGSVGQRDSFLSYAYRLYFNLGNLDGLESTSVDWPWEFQIRIQDVFRGNNADHRKEIGLNASLYF